MKMKAISLWQPWASAIALGAKRIETRSWSTNYRGPIAIHASKRFILWEMIDCSSSWTWCGVLGWIMGRGERPWESLPFGAIVATAELVDCRPTGSFTVDELDTERGPDTPGGLYKYTERFLGDFSPGRFGWVLANIKPLKTPIPYRGAQGLFDVEIPS